MRRVVRIVEQDHDWRIIEGEHLLYAASTAVEALTYIREGDAKLAALQESRGKPGIVVTVIKWEPASRVGIAVVKVLTEQSGRKHVTYSRKNA